jgi:mercuric ion binding protein
MKRTLTIIATIAALGTGGLAVVMATPAAAGSDAFQAAASERTETFAIANMTCALCPITVKTVMERVAGVKSVQVDLISKTATVVYDPSLATAGAIAEASKNVGYPAVPVQ